MNTFQLHLIRKALGDSNQFEQNLRGALELSLDSEDKAIAASVLKFFQGIELQPMGISFQKPYLSKSSNQEF